MNKLFVLTWLLRLHACVLLLALVPIIFPYSLMNWLHQLLGLGELHQAPITEYLTRSLSLVYALHGAVCLVLACDISRYLPLIRTIALFHFVFGLISLGIDIYAGLPIYWIIGEGPMISLFALFILWYSKDCSTSIETEPSSDRNSESSV